MAGQITPSTAGFLKVPSGLRILVSGSGVHMDMPYDDRTVGSVGPPQPLSHCRLRIRVDAFVCVAALTRMLCSRFSDPRIVAPVGIPPCSGPTLRLIGILEARASALTQRGSERSHAAATSATIGKSSRLHCADVAHEALSSEEYGMQGHTAVPYALRSLQPAPTGAVDELQTGGNLSWRDSAPASATPMKHPDSH